MSNPRLRYHTYYNGRSAAREFVIKQIYVKYYRRKFARGNFRASWIPDAEKLKKIIEEGNAKDPMDKGQLVTVNAVWTAPRNITRFIEFYFDVIYRLREYRNFLSLDAEFCLEHRGDEDGVVGLHLHIAHSNEFGVSKSDLLRRCFSGVKIASRLYGSAVHVAEPSVDVKVMPWAAAVKYIKKNREYDVAFGLGYQGLVQGELEVMREQLLQKYEERCAEVLANAAKFSVPPPQLLDLIDSGSEFESTQGSSNGSFETEEIEESDFESQCSE